MTDIEITVRRKESSYRVPVDLGQFVPTLKFDTGSEYTVISARMLDGSLTDDQLKNFKDYCEKHSRHKGQFISASGDPITGYPVTATNVVIDGSVLPVFHYYLVLENKREIALLGFDFIDRCECKHSPSGNFVITSLDQEGYGDFEGALQNDELAAYIDSLSIN